MEEEDEDYVFVDAKDLKKTFILSVNGVHCHINEPKDPKYRENPKYYSHKFKQAGYAYEVRLDRCLLSTRMSPGALRHPRVPSERVPCQTCALRVTFPLTL
jgi:hypothetical protein